MIPDVFLDDLFHGVALRAFVELASQCQGWPDIEATRRLAYSLYDQELAARSNSKASHRRATSRDRKNNSLNERSSTSQP